MSTPVHRRHRAVDPTRYLGRLFEQRHLELRRLCLHWARGHRADADDLFGEACLRALQATTRVEAPPDNPLAWLTTIVCNLARDRLRAPERNRQSPGATEACPSCLPDALDALAAKELLVRAAHEVRRLPRSQQRSLLARAAGDDYGAIASSVGTSPEAARKLVQLARSTLRKRLGLHLEHDGQKT